MPEHEVKRLLRSMAEEPEGTTQEGLDDLLDALRQYEKKFKMSTLEFYPKFLTGKMGDETDVLVWAGLYEAYMMLSQDLAGTKTATR
jgi:hypothetical protein